LFASLSISCFFHNMIWRKVSRAAVNHFRLRGLPMRKRVGLRMAPMIARLPILCRHGTTRAFVMSGHEHLPQEPVLGRDPVMERTPERFAIF
jgi:hypothetical protein